MIDKELSSNIEKLKDLLKRLEFISKENEYVLLTIKKK
jgi:hypothetical protein